jgi:putative transposase
VTSSDFIAYEDLKIHNLVHNRHLSKSISDASWGTFLQWVNYYGTVYNIPVMAVPPQFTTQDCSACETGVKKSLSIRTHVCPTCGAALDRDENAALNIRYAGLIIHLFMAFAGTVGQTGTSSDEENASGQNATTRRSRGRKTPTRHSPRGKAGKRAG